MEINSANFNSPIIISDLIEENSMLIAPSDFTALLVGYVEALNKPYSAAVKVERAILMDLIEKWLNDPENAKRLSLIKNIGE